MESCYVPNNPNFASVDQWTPPSPTSPPSEATSSKQQQQRSLRTQQQQEAAVFHDPGSVLQHLCSESDGASSAGANSSVVASSTASSAVSSAASSVDSSSHLTSLSALPPVQVIPPSRTQMSWMLMSLCWFLVATVRNCWGRAAVQTTAQDRPRIAAILSRPIRWRRSISNRCQDSSPSTLARLTSKKKLISY